MRAVGSIGTRLTEEIVGLEKMAAVRLIDAFGFGGGGARRNCCPDRVPLDVGGNIDAKVGEESGQKKFRLNS